MIRISYYYDTHPEVTDRLQNLTVKMLQGKQAAPKLRASAAACRALVPVAYHMANHYLNDADPIDFAAKTGMRHLHNCYILALDNVAPFDAAALKQHSIDFALQYVALETHHAGHLGVIGLGT